MGEKIVFPKLYEQYVNQGMASFEAGSMQAAAESFSLAYEIKQEDMVNVLLTTALFQLNRSQDALELVEEKEALYLNDTQLTAFYVQLLIQAEQFEDAKVLIAEKAAMSEEKELWQNLSEFLQQEEERIQVTQIAERIKEIEAKTAITVADATVLMTHLTQIPPAFFQQAVNAILQHPEVQQLAKTNLIEALIDLGIEETYQLLWFGETKEVSLKQVGKVSESSHYHYFQKALKSRLENSNPVAYQGILEEGCAHFYLMYPFHEEVIGQEDSSWLDLYLAYLAQDQSAMERLNQLSEERQQWYTEWFLRFSEQRIIEMGC
ncbi:hypothetical protein [Isobaculum melis]|uniref:Tetratricopeptide repeat-containing protein n=1 Tax=Isobaculum melis TaxID=142588 RepID=A0A1H9U959_9LACT|nr:hypothetical protein [Isobaculum melis]SES05872.1 hypothetical protein SAMN04488559_1245 [Isobaculum melis]